MQRAEAALAFRTVALVLPCAPWWEAPSLACAPWKTVVADLAQWRTV